MKRLFYVDFENVSSAGLNGVLRLTGNDEVKIFLGPKCSKMSLIEAESVLHCDATVELIKNDQIDGASCSDDADPDMPSSGEIKGFSKYMN